MKRRTILIFFIVSGFVCNAFAQPYSIVADKTRGCDSLTVQFNCSPSPLNNPVTWNFGNGTTSTTATPPPVKYDTSGVYLVTMSVKVGATTNNYTQTINIHPRPNPYFTFTDPDANGSTTRNFNSPPLNGSYTYHYFWNFPVVDSTFDTIPNTSYNFNTPGVYPVTYTVTDNFGCKSVLNQNVDILELFEVPNVFTPNGDGVHENFTVFSAFGSIITLKIFNRYGLLVFQDTAEKVSWDGTVYGHKLGSGIYYYQINAVKTTTGIPHTMKKTGFFYMFTQ